MPYDPEYTPELDTLEIDSARAIIATVAIVIGLLLAVFSTTAAVAHYGYDVRIYKKHSQQLQKPALIAGSLVILGVGGIFLIVAGTAMLRRRVGEPDGS